MPDLGVTSIGKYRILELVGEGAMGVVYRALDSVLNRPVAIKVMNDAVARQTELRERFLREAQAAGSLQHPNVITIYDFGEVEGHLYIAMEYVAGVDLETLLARHEPLTLEAKLDLVTDVLTGLAYAHKHGVVHRDVKPANIRVTEEGRAKIMDFGVAHLTSSDMTSTGMMMGTPNYMAPEQVTGGRLTPASDLFSVGAVLYELLTGARPFEGPTLHAVLYKIVSEDPPSVHKLLPGLPSALDRVVKRALAKDVGERYASAVDMANDLTAVRATLSGDRTSGTISLRASVASAEAARAAARVAAERRRAYRAVAAGGVALAASAAFVLWSITGGHGSSASTEQRDATAPSTASTTTGAATAAISPTPPTPTATNASPASPAAPAAPSASPDAPAASYAAPPRSSAPPAAPARGATSRSASAATTTPVPPPRPTRRAAAPAPGAAPGAAPAVAPGTPGAPARTPNDSPAAPPPVVVPPAAPASSAAAVPSAPPPASSAPPPAPAPSPAAEIAGAITAYARAIESRDVAEVRRAYRGITPDQERGFTQFFDAARSLRATFSVADVTVTGPGAEARVVGAYDYVTADGKRQHQPVTFVATLRHEGGTWRLMGVR